MSLNAYGHKQTNQILDFDERHCINEYKSAYVLRCRSTNLNNIFQVLFTIYIPTIIMSRLFPKCTVPSVHVVQ